MADIFDRRIIRLNDRPTDENGRCVIYWMQRSQRAFDNIALKFAVDRANHLHKPLLVYFGLSDRYPMASARAFAFMLEGLKETSAVLSERRIGFAMRREEPREGVGRAASEFEACCVVVDEDYLNMGRKWRDQAARKLDVTMYQVDAETVVPARYMDKEEWGAYTMRPKVTKALGDYFVEIPESEVTTPWSSDTGEGIDMSVIDPLELTGSLDVDRDVAPTPLFSGGITAARRRLQDFINNDLARYATERNEIGVSVSSDLSPYLHFGQISSLRAALTVESSDAPHECIDAFLEQLIVRRELAINFCLYNPDYASLDAAADWAKATLDAHRSDDRPELLSIEEIEAARTYEDLWNAAQVELTRYGKIHPYMRMVWAKKLLEWSATPEEALSRAIYLNDKYALDGRDPNGYANIAWCIYGKHDRPFAERPIFGKIRYMSIDATKRKARWKDYVRRVQGL